MAKVKIDRFGRILVPKEVRRILGIKEGMELEMEIKDEKIVIRPVDRSLEKRLKN